MDGRDICSNRRVDLYSGAHVLTYGSFQGRYEYEDRYDGTYSQAPAGVCGVFRQRKLRKIVNEASAATETYLAHQLHDKAGAIATPLGLIVLLFVFDWRLGILSLVPVILGFLIMMKMTGPRMEQKMKEYQNALDDMSNEAVEYIRGIPVVKLSDRLYFHLKNSRIP